MSGMQWFPLVNEPEPVVNPSADQEPPQQNSVAARLVLTNMEGSAAEGSSPGVVSEQQVRMFVLQAPDAELLDAVCTVEHNASYDQFRPNKRGRWRVALQQQTDTRTFVNVTQPKEIHDPGQAPFRLGSPRARLVNGKPAFLSITYSSTNTTDPLFWATALAVDCTVHMAN